MLELLYLILIHPFCMPGLIIILNGLSLPWEYLGLCNAGIVSLWSIFLFPWNRPYVDAHWDFYGELIIAGINFFIIIQIAFLLIIRLFEKKEHQKPKNIQTLNFLSFTAYGILAAYFSFLFFTDLWYSYRSPWQAYTNITAVVITATLPCLLISKYADRYRFFSKLKDLSVFIYSFAGSIIIILFANLIFPIIARQEVKKAIQEIGDRHTKYCIQSNRKPINSWLSLTPITTWNKPNGSRGAGRRHAVLVIENNDLHTLYHWSYKLRKWEFTSEGFEPGAFAIPSALKCIPELNYSDKLPFWF